MTDCKADVVLAIDSSGSILKGRGADQNWNRVKNFARNLVVSLNDIAPIGATGIQLGLLQFSDR